MPVITDPAQMSDEHKYQTGYWVRAAQATGRLAAGPRRDLIATDR